MTPDDCPKFISCRAPICPLDRDWRRRRHLRGEPICHWLHEAVKADAKANFEGAGRGELFAHVSTVVSEIASGHAPIRKALERSARLGSRLGRQAPRRAKP
jgi:hypothetical protein